MELIIVRSEIDKGRVKGVGRFVGVGLVMGFEK